MKALRHPGVLAALAAAVLFGFGTPLAKLLIGQSSPWLMAALLYLGAGVGLLIWRRISGQPKLTLPRQEAGWFAGAIAFGGVAGPLVEPAAGDHHLLRDSGRGGEQGSEDQKAHAAAVGGGGVGWEHYLGRCRGAGLTRR